LNKYTHWIPTNENVNSTMRMLSVEPLMDGCPAQDAICAAISARLPFSRWDWQYLSVLLDSVPHDREALPILAFRTICRVIFSDRQLKHRVKWEHTLGGRK
jgi:hypothetical protein